MDGDCWRCWQRALRNLNVARRRDFRDFNRGGGEGYRFARRRAIARLPNFYRVISVNVDRPRGRTRAGARIHVLQERSRVRLRTLLPTVCSLAHHVLCPPSLLPRLPRRPSSRVRCTLLLTPLTPECQLDLFLGHGRRSLLHAWTPNGAAIFPRSFFRSSASRSRSSSERGGGAGGGGEEYATRRSHHPPGENRSVAASRPLRGSVPFFVNVPPPRGLSFRASHANGAAPLPDVAQTPGRRVLPVAVISWALGRVARHVASAPPRTVNDCVKSSSWVVARSRPPRTAYTHTSRSLAAIDCDSRAPRFA